MAGPVAVLLQHGGGAGAQGAVAEQLHGPHVHVVVVQAALGRRIAQIVGLLPLRGLQGHEDVGAQLELAGLVQGLIDLVEHLHGGAGVHGGGQAVGEQLLLGQQEGLLLLLNAVGGQQGGDGVHGRVGDAALELPGLVLQILAALGVGGVLGDAGQLKGHGVDPAHVAVRPGQEDRVVGGHGVQLLLGGIGGVLPHAVQPAPAANPLAGLGLGHLGGHSGQDVLLGLPEGVDLQQALTQAVDVHVALDEAGHDGLAPQVHDLGAGADIGLHAGLVAHVDQPVALDGNGAGGGEVLVNRIDVAVAVHAVSGFRAGGGGGEDGQEHGEGQNCGEHAEHALFS